MKKRVAVLIALLMIITILPYVNAGFFDIFKRITGRPITEQTNVSVSVGNVAPVIFNVQITSIDLNEGTTKDVIFNFSARDDNGISDLNDASAFAAFNKSTEPVRSGTCILVETTSSNKTYQCTITMQFFDMTGGWTVNASIRDNGGNYNENVSTSVDVNLLRAISITPTSIGFPAVAPGGTNIISSQNTSVTNNGNYEGTLDITSYNLTGETISSEQIPAENFRSAGLSGVSTVCSTGTLLADQIAATITSSGLPRGSSAQENVTYCLTLVPSGISTQTYSTIGAGSQPWLIATT